MADKRKEQNTDTLGSIFNFIFDEIEKPPEKRKPVRYSNVSGSSEVVDTLTSVLERPGLYVSDQMMKNLDDGLNQQLIEVYLGKASPQGKTKIGSRDLIKMFTDPNDFFDKAYQKSKRKMTVAQWSGKQYRGLNAQGWARKQGIKDKDTLWALNRAAAAFDDPGERLDMVIDGERLNKKAKAIESVITSCDYFGLGSDTARIAKELDKLDNIDSLTDIDRALSSAGVSDPNLISMIRGNFNSHMGEFDGFNKKIEKAYKPGPFSFSGQNMGLYRDVTAEYLGNKANSLEHSTDSDDQKMREAYIKAARLMKNWKLDDKDNKKVLIERKKELQKVKGDIRLLKSRGASSSALKDLKDLEKQLSSDVKFLGRNRAQDQYAKYKGMWGSLNSMYLKGNLAGAILDGTFFSSDNTIPLNPVETDYMGSQFYGEVPILFNIAKDDKFFEIDKNDKFSRRRRSNVYNRTFTTLSYFTPQKFLKLDGSYFAYKMYNDRMDTFEKIMDLSSHQDLLAKRFTKMGLFLKDDSGRMDFSKFGSDDEYKQLMKDLENLFSQPGWNSYFANNAQVLALFNKFKKLDADNQKLVRLFSAGYRYKEEIKNKIMAATIDKWRGAFADRLLSRFGSNRILGPAIRQWKLKGSIQGLMRGFAENLLKKWGFSGVMFNAVAGAMSAGLSFLAFSVFKLLGKALVVALIGLVMVIGVGASFGNSLMQKYSPVSHIEPGEVIECEGFEPEGLINPESIFNPDVPPPSNSSCPFGEGAMICMQGYVEPRGSWSHTFIRHKKPVDLRPAASRGGFYFYAPDYCDQGGCRITVDRPANVYRCIDHSKDAGDEVIFNDGQGNEFLLVHAKSLVSLEQEVSAGQAVAYIYGAGELPIGSCWGGPHIHLEIRHNGQYIDPPSFLQAMGCNVPDESQCTN